MAVTDVKMAKVDNLEAFLPFLQFDDKDDFYYLQILQRKKENPQLGSNSRVIKNYYIKSADKLIARYDEIKELCEHFNARASLRLNRRNFRRVAYKAMQNMANSMANQEYSFIQKSYDRACGLGHAEPKGGNTWILDMDEPLSPTDTVLFMEVLERANPKGNKILASIPSKSGYHYITKPFDLREFREAFPEIDVHKDNPTNLYIP